MAAGALRGVVGAAAAGVLAAGFAAGPAVARDVTPVPSPLADAGVAKVAPDVLVDHILTALMFEPDWRLAVALFQAFQRHDDGAGEAWRVARDILLFLPVDQGRQAAPHLLLALAPEDEAAQMELAVDLAAIIGEDATDLAARTRRDDDGQAALLPLSMGARLPGPFAGPADPPPTAPAWLVQGVGTMSPVQVSAALDADRAWAVALYRLLTTMPDHLDTDAYAQWYALWQGLAAGGGATGAWTSSPVEGGATASPR